MSAHGTSGPYFATVTERQVHLAELLAALSLAADLGMGRPQEHALRATYLAGRLALKLGLSDAGRADVLYASLLQEVGCVAYAHEMVKALHTDEIALHAVEPFVRNDAMRMIGVVLARAGSAGPLLARPAVLARLFAGGYRAKGSATGRTARSGRSSRAASAWATASPRLSSGSTSGGTDAG